MPTRMAAAAVLEFGWSGTVTDIDPTLAAALPPNTELQLGAPAFVHMKFESATQDTLPGDPQEADYQGAITEFVLVAGEFVFRQQVSPAENTILLLVQPGFAIYEPVTTVDAAPALPGNPLIDGDVFFVSSTNPLPDDSLPLVSPDPDPLAVPKWDSANAGILDDYGNVLIDLTLTEICTGACQPLTTGGDPVPVGGGAGWLVLTLLLGGARMARSGQA